MIPGLRSLQSPGGHLLGESGNRRKPDVAFTLTEGSTDIFFLTKGNGVMEPNTRPLPGHPGSSSQSLALWARRSKSGRCFQPVAG